MVSIVIGKQNKPNRLYNCVSITYLIIIFLEKRFQPPKKDEISDLILKEIEPSSALINQEEMQKAPYEIKNQLEGSCSNSHNY